MLKKVLFCMAVVAAAIVVSAAKSHGQAKTDAPRDERGELKRSAWLPRAPMSEPVSQIANWADIAPRLAGLPGMNDQQAETVPEKGIGPEGETLRTPMHIYRMNRGVKAIVAYVKLLPQGPTER